LVLKYFFKCFW